MGVPVLEGDVADVVGSKFEEIITQCDTLLATTRRASGVGSVFITGFRKLVEGTEDIGKVEEALYMTAKMACGVEMPDMDLPYRLDILDGVREATTPMADLEGRIRKEKEVERQKMILREHRLDDADERQMNTLLKQARLGQYAVRKAGYDAGQWEREYAENITFNDWLRNEAAQREDAERGALA